MGEITVDTITETMVVKLTVTVEVIFITTIMTSTAIVRVVPSLKI